MFYFFKLINLCNAFCNVRNDRMNTYDDSSDYDILEGDNDNCDEWKKEK